MSWYLYGGEPEVRTQYVGECECVVGSAIAIAIEPSEISAVITGCECVCTVEQPSVRVTAEAEAYVRT